MALDSCLLLYQTEAKYHFYHKLWYTPQQHNCSVHLWGLGGEWTILYHFKHNLVTSVRVCVYLVITQAYSIKNSQIVLTPWSIMVISTNYHHYYNSNDNISMCLYSQCFASHSATLPLDEWLHQLRWEEGRTGNSGFYSTITMEIGRF